MSFPEVDQSKTTIEEILAQYGISPLPSLNARVRFQDSRGTLSFKGAMELAPQDLLREPLATISEGELKAVEFKKHGGKPRPKREINAIRESYWKEKSRLLARGPGAVLAAIALNPEKKARWERTGLVGNGGWSVPPEEESAWWGWVYGVSKKGVKVKERWESKEGDILHALYIMRFRRGRGDITEDVFESFKNEIDRLIPEGDEGLGEFLRGIAKHFNVKL
ncbi:hypothetical protein COT65_02430 [Candidatus Shapirobacteria bacterium CG09_land_8_20_14_0_10_47_13]|uniref:Uncharacterized protein n=1 Tax=Candidatus Shapirobacteria bacterium CG09_land_8_20_14_0_10_47_13 TaxID=1974481 RepID=A0A2H0WMD5_9BACT|nr:MAG: hypothetical protein COT65_02430 [Candidatus Shapirobacteria bacterium CG09_land_8_20_14_0_10_47_13]